LCPKEKVALLNWGAKYIDEDRHFNRDRQKNFRFLNCIQNPTEKAFMAIFSHLSAAQFGCYRYRTNVPSGEFFERTNLNIIRIQYTANLRPK